MKTVKAIGLPSYQIAGDISMIIKALGRAGRRPGDTVYGYTFPQQTEIEDDTRLHM